MTKVKICGLTREIDMEYANNCRPDYVGFVFAESRRRVGIAHAAKLKALLDPAIQAVGVFVNERIDIVAEAVSSAGLDCVQLHGGESEEYISALKKSVSAKIIKVYRIAADGTTPRIAANSRDVAGIAAGADGSSADITMFDAYVNGEAGGSGVTFPWELLRDFDFPFILAGGLNPENVAEAMVKTKPWGVDVSSGVETDVCKDFEKMQKFVNIVRGDI
jgi:phosphoribosylanthranilate isomerase